MVSRGDIPARRARSDRRRGRRLAGRRGPPGLRGVRGVPARRHGAFAQRSAASRGVRVGTITALITYVAQAGVGLAGRTDIVPFNGGLHLLGGIAVFSVLLATLAVRVETTAGDRLMAEYRTGRITA